MQGKRGAAGLRRGAGGYYYVYDPDPRHGQPHLFERDTYTCAHCNTLHTIPPLASQQESPGRCHQCDKLICQNCLNKGCVPFEKQLEEQERSFMFLRNLGLV